MDPTTLHTVTAKVWGGLASDSIEEDLLSGDTSETYAKEFLQLFEDNIAKIPICTIFSSGSANKAKHRSLFDALAYNQTNNTDVYFYPNGGGTKQTEISTIRACFVDIDAGRDKNGGYLQPKLVEKRKDKMRDAMKQFPAPPSAVVETRNGFHLYWIMENKLSGHNPSDLIKWGNTQATIVKFFEPVGGDSRAAKLNQLMRVPGSMWKKQWANKTAFLTTFYDLDNQYTMDGLIRLISKPKKASKLIAAKVIPASIYGSETGAVDTNSVITTSTATQTRTDIQTVKDTINFLSMICTQNRALGQLFLADSAYKLAKDLSVMYNLPLPFTTK